MKQRPGAAHSLYFKRETAMHRVTYVWLAIVLAVACGAISWLGIAGWIAAVVLAASVAMHVAGNAIGTNLRDAADRRLERVPRQAPELPETPPGHLEQRTPLSRLVPVATGIGAAGGGVAGAVALVRLAAASPAGAVLGGVSSAVVGGLIGFLATSLFEIIRTSVREAAAADRRG